MSYRVRGLLVQRCLSFMPCAVRWPWLLVTLPLLAAVVWALLAPWVVERHLCMDLRLREPGQAWSLRWVRTANGDANGMWLAVSAAGADLHGTTPQGTAAAYAISFEQVLPTYPFAELTLRWDGSPGVRGCLHGVRVIDLVYGFAIRAHELRLGASSEARLLASDALPQQFTTTAASGGLPLRGMNGLGRTVYWAGYALTLVALAVVSGAVALAARVPWTALARRTPWVVLAVGLVVLVRVWVAAWAPFFYCADSTDYIAGALRFFESRNLGQFDAVRPPGYSLWLALLLSMRAAPSSVIAAANALLGVLTAVLTYLTLRRFVAPPWPLVGLLLVGLDPILLTFERYALTETPTLFVMVLIVWVATSHFVRDTSRRAGRYRELLSAAALGLCCAGAINLRSNLVPLLILAPLALLGSALCHRMRPWVRLAAPAVALGVALALLPGAALRERATVARSFTPLKRLESVGEFQRTDFNQTALLSYAAWTGKGPWDYRAFSRAQALAEMFARRPRATLMMAAQSFAYLSGLLVHPAPNEFIGANAYLALPLRGRPAEMNPDRTNFVPLTKHSGSYPTVAAAYPSLACDTSYLATCVSCAWFDRLFDGYHLLLPPLAILSLVGTLIAMGKRCYGILAAALLALGNLMPFVYLLSPTDRYGLPFRVALLPAAVYALHCLCQAARRTQSSPTCA